MAKTTTVKGKVDIVDLIRDRKLFPLLNVPAVRVIVEFEVTTTGLLATPAPAPSAKIERMQEAARRKLDDYEKIITEECAKFNKKIDGLLNEGNLKEAQSVAATVNTLVKNALASAEAAAQKAVEDAKKKESQGDKLLTEARVKTAVKVTFAGVSLATQATKLAVSYGADVTAYFSIAKTLVQLGLELKQQLKDEPKLREDLRKGLDAYIALRTTKVMEAARANGLTNTSNFPGFPQVFGYIADAVLKTGSQISKGKDKSQIAQEVLQFTYKGVAAQFKDVETARQMYRNHTTKMRHKVDDVSVQADKLLAAMKKAANLKEGVKIGAECMQVKGKVRVLATALDQAVGFLEAMEQAMQSLGLKCDDRTILEKLKAIDKSTIFTEGADLVSNISGVYSLVQAVSAAVG
jgi:hypothetical protein